MQLTPHQALLQFAHVLQMTLLPRLEEELGRLSPQLQLLSSLLAMISPNAALEARRARTGRPQRDRVAMASAFVAKAILNLSTTRQLIDRLHCDAALRRLCGFTHADTVPHEATFSRAFEQFATTQLPQQLHEALIRQTQGDRLIGHIARDSTAIEARERFPDPPPKARKKGQSQKKKNKRTPPLPRKKGQHARAKASQRGTRIQQQRHQELDTMLANLACQCDIGAKKNSQGHENYWRGYKLHLDVANGQIPISAVLTGASVHDSQVAIPLMTMTSQRVVHLYELMDSAYDADAIHAHSRQLNHAPIIAPHPRRGAKKPSPLTKVFPARPAPQLSWAEQDRFRERTMVERVNGRLKDEFGASHVRVRGAAKVMAHVMFGVLALTVDQWLRLAGSPGP